MIAEVVRNYNLLANDRGITAFLASAEHNPFGCKSPAERSEVSVHDPSASMLLPSLANLTSDAITSIIAASEVDSPAPGQPSFDAAFLSRSVLRLFCACPPLKIEPNSIPRFVPRDVSARREVLGVEIEEPRAPTRGQPNAAGPSARPAAGPSADAEEKSPSEAAAHEAPPRPESPPPVEAADLTVLAQLSDAAGRLRALLRDKDLKPVGFREVDSQITARC